MKKYLVKNAWFISHETLGDIMCFIMTPKVETSPNTLGYHLDNQFDEVFRFRAFYDTDFIESIICRMDVIGNNMWQMSPYGDLIELELDLSEFKDELIYQSNYGRNVLFHTSNICFKELDF